MELRELRLAEYLLRKVLHLCPNEPQSYRDLALVLQQQEKYEESIRTMYEVVIRNWGPQYKDINLIALVDLNRIITLYKDTYPLRGIPKSIDRSFIHPFDLDLRVVLTWDTESGIKFQVLIHLFKQMQIYMSMNLNHLDNTHTLDTIKHQSVHL